MSEAVGEIPKLRFERKTGLMYDMMKFDLQTVQDRPLFLLPRVGRDASQLTFCNVLFTTILQSLPLLVIPF